MHLVCLIVVLQLAYVHAGRDYYEVLKLEKTATDKDIKRVRLVPARPCGARLVAAG